MASSRQTNVAGRLGVVPLGPPPTCSCENPATGMKGGNVMKA